MSYHLMTDEVVTRVHTRVSTAAMYKSIVQVPTCLHGVPRSRASSHDKKAHRTDSRQ